MLEPSPAALRNPLKRYFLATRPAFLSVTALAALLGLAAAFYAGEPIHALRALLSVLLALLAHAGVNVLNDYYDALSGTDAANQERLFPFTGGSRFIQNGVLSQAQTARFGAALLAGVMLGGFALTPFVGAGLLGIGAAGLLIGWGYCAPPLNLAARGLGEWAVSAGFLLIVLGSAFVQSGQVSLAAWVAGVPYALLVANMLFINQFPDRAADAAARKRTLVVRLGAERSAPGYLYIAALAYGVLLAAVGLRALPGIALLALLAAPLTLRAGRTLLRHAARPALLGGAIRQTILAAHLFGILLVLGLIAGAQR